MLTRAVQCSPRLTPNTLCIASIQINKQKTLWYCRRRSSPPLRPIDSEAGGDSWVVPPGVGVRSAGCLAGSPQRLTMATCSACPESAVDVMMVYPFERPHWWSNAAQPSNACCSSDGNCSPLGRPMRTLHLPKPTWDASIHDATHTQTHIPASAHSRGLGPPLTYCTWQPHLGRCTLVKPAPPHTHTTSFPPLPPARQSSSG